MRELAEALGLERTTLTRSAALLMRNGRRWLFAGDRPSRYGDFFRLSETDREVLDATFAAMGALVVGRGTYDVVEGWGGSHPLAGVPIFVLTHRPPQEAPRGRTPFTFVTDGIDAAIPRARAAAVLLGAGVRWFDRLGTSSIQLERTQVIEGSAVTHLRFRVVR